jgi:hypothetical protein
MTDCGQQDISEHGVCGFELSIELCYNISSWEESHFIIYTFLLFEINQRFPKFYSFLSLKKLYELLAPLHPNKFKQTDLTRNSANELHIFLS